MAYGSELLIVNKLFIWNKYLNKEIRDLNASTMSCLNKLNSVNYRYFFLETERDLKNTYWNHIDWMLNEQQ